MDLKNASFRTLVDACEAVVPAQQWLQHRAVVAVSGGADSVALFRTLTHIAGKKSATDANRLVVGHVDHAVRGDASAADGEFVKQLAKTFGADFVSVKLDLRALLGEREKASEEVLRDARYQCLRKIARDNDARYLFTGHHLNDQAETILFRIFRGTGLAGLQGIPPIRRDQNLTILRPLLTVPKATILEALTAADQPFRIDTSNATNDYSRNFIRNEILPSASYHYGLPIEESIVRLAQHAGSASEIESYAVDQVLASRQPGNDTGKVSMKTAKLSGLPIALIRAILIRLWQENRWPQDQMTFDRWQCMARKIQQSSVKPYVENLPGNLRFEVCDDELKVTCETLQS